MLKLRILKKKSTYLRRKRLTFLNDYLCVLFTFGCTGSWLLHMGFLEFSGRGLLIPVASRCS